MIDTPAIEIMWLYEPDYVRERIYLSVDWLVAITQCSLWSYDIWRDRNMSIIASWHLPLVVIKWESLLMAGDNDDMFMTRSLRVTPKTTEQHLIVRSDKSVACVTNNKRVCWTFGTIAWPLCDSRATCFQCWKLTDLSLKILNTENRNCTTFYNIKQQQN